MKKFLCVLTSCFALFTYASAIEVNEAELQVPGSDGIQFENYGGPYAVIESVDAIIGIGTALGREVAAALETPATIQPGAKYTLVHAIDLQTQGALDADILLLNENAGVDHIKNLRRIIMGYLEAAYGYTREDAETVATFVTIYNAVYRNNLDNFTAKYKDIVLQYLTADKVGLSTNWQDWPGRTQIVIPLNDVNGGLSSVDTTTISDENVVEALQDEPGKGISEREALASLKERESADAAEKAKTAQKEAAQERKDGDKAAAAKSAQESKEQQQLADRKATEARNDRQEIAKDKEVVASGQADVQVVPNYLTGLFVVDDAKGMYRLVTVNADTGVLVRRSPITQVRSRTVYGVSNVTVVKEDGSKVTYPQMYLAVCGENAGKSAVKLCLIDTESMELQKQSEETLAEGTALVPYNDVFFAVVQQGKEYYAAAFDKNVTMLKKSALAIKPTSPFNITDRGILVTDTNGNPRLLDTRDLSTLWTSAAIDAK
ncbi:MAG: hypothetical protein IJS09_10450 [Treponema sp.]|nr:hypothetical protein [Treponema sp.]